MSFTIHTRGQERRGRLGLSVGENVVEIRTQSQEGFGQQNLHGYDFTDIEDGS